MPAKRDPLLTAKGTRYTYAGWVRAYNAALKSGIPNLAYRLGDSYPDFYNKHQEQARKSDLGSRQRQQVSEADKRILDDARKNGETLAEYVKRREGRTEYIARFNGKQSHQYAVAAQIERDAKDLLRRTPSKPVRKPATRKPSAKRPSFGSPPPSAPKKPTRKAEYTPRQRALIREIFRYEREIEKTTDKMLSYHDFHKAAASPENKKISALRGKQREAELKLYRLNKSAAEKTQARITERNNKYHNKRVRDTKKKEAFQKGKFTAGDWLH